MAFFDRYSLILEDDDISATDIISEIVTCRWEKGNAFRDLSTFAFREVVKGDLPISTADCTLLVSSGPLASLFFREYFLAPHAQSDNTHVPIPLDTLHIERRLFPEAAPTRYSLEILDVTALSGTSRSCVLLAIAEKQLPKHSTAANKALEQLLEAVKLKLAMLKPNLRLHVKALVLGSAHLGHAVSHGLRLAASASPSVPRAAIAPPSRSADPQSISSDDEYPPSAPTAEASPPDDLMLELRLSRIARNSHALLYRVELGAAAEQSQRKVHLQQEHLMGSSDPLTRALQPPNPYACLLEDPLACALQLFDSYTKSEGKGLGQSDWVSIECVLYSLYAEYAALSSDTIATFEACLSSKLRDSAGECYEPESLLVSLVGGGAEQNQALDSRLERGRERVRSRLLERGTACSLGNSTLAPAALSVFS